MPSSNPAITVTLYRPVGPDELALLKAAGFKRWPPRLPEQPIFYPVTTEGYAAEIASNWNVRDHGSGFVTRFEVRREFMDRYEIQQVGASRHTEWWIPAGDLEALNDNIVGDIEVIRSFGAIEETRTGGALRPALMILVAGPYRSGTGDDPAKLAANVRLMESYALPIFRAGHVPVLGEWFALPLASLAGSTAIGDAAFTEVFHPVAERLLEHCTGVLRVGGPSQGADMMVRVAQARGLAVYHDLRAIPGCESS